MALTYNQLNLPKSVTKGTDNLEYLYDARGNKHAIKVNGTVDKYYTGEIVYTSVRAVDYILTPEGMARPTGGTFAYQYNLTDHLGSVRAVVNQNGTVEQATDYYPFGMAFSTNNLTKNNYLYNNKELQNQTLSSTFFGMYDYGARYYDPVIGRWGSVDPMAEKSRRWSPYNYCYDNPLRFIDPDGKKVENPNNYVLSNKNLIKKIKEFDLAVAKLSGKSVSSFTITVTGGDRYKKGDKIFSSTTNSEIKNSASKSKHLQSEGATAVDLATSDISYDILKNAAKEAGFRIDPSGSYDDGHIHIDLADTKYKSDYLKDDKINKSNKPTNKDFEHNSDPKNPENKSSKNTQPTWQQIYSVFNNWLQQNPSIIIL